MTRKKKGVDFQIRDNTNMADQLRLFVERLTSMENVKTKLKDKYFNNKGKTNYRKTENEII